MARSGWNWLTSSRVWRSIYTTESPATPVGQAQVTNGSVLLHLHPVKVKRHGLAFTYTWGLGGLSFAAFLILAFTGVFLMFYYVPSTERAYKSMVDLQYNVHFGWTFRNVHRWTAHLMVGLVTLHMTRVFITGSYKRREFNWVIGVFALLLTLGLSFTGYLLPWDQLAYWAITIGTSLASYIPGVGEQVRGLLLGGGSIGQSTLIRFYVLHVAILPLLLVSLLSLHFWRVRKDGGISGPPADAAGSSNAPTD